MQSAQITLRKRQSVSLHYVKLPYVGSFSLEATKRPRELIQRIVREH